MNTWTHWFASFALSMAPFALLIVFWLYFVKQLRTSRQRELVDRSFQHMDRVEALLDRIAKAVEASKAQ